jgi:hypothetical protein
MTGTGIVRCPMPTILKRSTAFITRTRCWNTRSQASESAVDTRYGINALVSRVKSGLLSDVARMARSIARTDGHIISRREDSLNDTTALE